MLRGNEPTGLPPRRSSSSDASPLKMPAGKRGQRVAAELERLELLEIGEQPRRQARQGVVGEVELLELVEPVEIARLQLTQAVAAEVEVRDPPEHRDRHVRAVVDPGRAHQRVAHRERALAHAPGQPGLAAVHLPGGLRLAVGERRVLIVEHRLDLRAALEFERVGGAARADAEAIVVGVGGPDRVAEHHRPGRGPAEIAEILRAAGARRRLELRLEHDAVARAVRVADLDVLVPGDRRLDRLAAREGVAAVARARGDLDSGNAGGAPLRNLVAGPDRRDHVGEGGVGAVVDGGDRGNRRI